MAVTLSIRFTRSLIEKLEREARKAGLSLEEYILELALQGLDPSERAVEYIEASKNFLEQAREELNRGDIRRAAEKLWSATALAIKAYAMWRDGKRLASYGELWKYKRRIEKELGDWISDAWAHGNAMHICFYEGWCAAQDVEKAMERVERLVKKIAELISKSS